MNPKTRLLNVISVLCNGTNMSSLKISSLKSDLVIILITVLLICSFAQASLEDSRWPAEKANAWYRDKAWPVGCNLLPSTAVNPIEMWNADTFDPKTIDKELGWASDIGFNTVRVYVHFIVWQQDPEGLKDRMSDFFEIADSHGMTVMLVLFDDCFNQDPVIGKQPEPRPGVHNSRWSASPGRELRKKEHWDKLEEYTKDIIGEFKECSTVYACPMELSSSMSSLP